MFIYRLLLCGVSGTGAKEKAKGERKIKQEEDEDYRELPQKKHKLYGRALCCLSVLPWEAERHPLRPEGESLWSGGLIDFGVSRI